MDEACEELLLAYDGSLIISLALTLLQIENKLNESMYFTLLISFASNCSIRYGYILNEKILYFIQQLNEYKK